MSRHPRLLLHALVPMLAGAVLLAAGCGTNGQDKAPAAAGSALSGANPKLGVIDLEQAVAAHPLYGELQKKRQELATLSRLAGIAAPETPSGGLSAAGTDGRENEFAARMGAKKAALEAKLEQQAEAARRDVANELAAYAAELDAKYQNQVLNLRLKLNTLQMSNDEKAAIEKELNGIEHERAALLAQREKELNAKMESKLAEDKAAASKEMEAYAGQLRSELSSRREAVDEEMSRIGRHTGGRTPADDEIKQRAAEITAKQREIAALEEEIMAAVRDKAAKIALQQGLDAVLTRNVVKTGGVDITMYVVAEFKNGASNK